MSTFMLNDGGVRTASSEIGNAKATLKRASEQIKAIKVPDGFTKKAELSSIAYAVDTNATFAGRISNTMQSAITKMYRAESANRILLRAFHLKVRMSLAKRIIKY